MSQYIRHISTDFSNVNPMRPCHYWGAKYAFYYSLWPKVDAYCCLCRLWNRFLALVHLEYTLWYKTTNPSPYGAEYATKAVKYTSCCGCNSVFVVFFSSLNAEGLIGMALATALTLLVGYLGLLNLYTEGIVSVLSNLGSCNKLCAFETGWLYAELHLSRDCVWV